MRPRFHRIFSSVAGGALVGLGVGLIPPWGSLSEMRNFQIVLLEWVYRLLAPWAPKDWMRALSTLAGEWLIFLLLGAAVGGLFGLAGHVVRRRAPGYAPRLAPAVIFTSGLFAFLWALLWSRIVLVHSSTARLLSYEGLVVVVGALGVGAAVGSAMVGLNRALKWISAGRLWIQRAVWASGLGLAMLLSASRAYPSVPPTPASAVRQVVLLGADGATWDVALPMIRQGRLPNLAELMRRGTWGDIRATLPWKSPILWTSIATGKREREHGIHDFVVRDREHHAVLPASVSSRKVKAVWDIASEAGRTVDVIGWYAGWPAEPVNGVFVADRMAYGELAQQVFPVERWEEIGTVSQEVDRQAAEAGERAVTGLGVGEHEVPRDERISAAVGLHLLEKDRPDLHLMYLREIDDMQHFFWRFHATRKGSPLARWLYPPIPLEEVERKGRKIEAAYEQMDDVLGKILERTGPETVVIVVSDHGGGIKAPGELNFSLNPILARWGLSVSDSTKRVWYEERDLFVNERSEGPLGGEVSAQEKRRILQEAGERLKGLRTSSGARVVTGVRLRQSKEEGVFLSARVNVRLKPGEVIRGDGWEIPVSEVVWPQDLTGTHRMHGMLAVAGPGVRRGQRVRAASVLDVTPTLLYLLDLPVGRDMAGRVLLDLFEPSLRRERKVKWVSTHETGQRKAAAPQGGTTADEKMLEDLRSLGYIQ